MIQPAAGQDISKLIAAWNVRLRLQQALHWLPRGLSAGLVAAIVIGVAARLRPILLQEQVLVVGLGAAAAGGLIAFVVVWLWPRPTLDYARRYDALFGLKERLSTALELVAGRLVAVHGEIAALQLEDAVTKARSVDYRAHMPLTIRWRDWLVALGLLALFLLVWWLPNQQAAVAAQQQAFAQALEGQVADLRDMREEVLSDSSLTEEEREAILNTLDETMETLEQPDVSREEAVATLSEAEEQLREMADNAEDARRMGDLAEAGAALNEEPAQELGEAMQQGDMESAAQHADLLGQRLEGLSEAQRQQLAEQLEQAAEALEGSNPEMAQQMREAAEALREGDLEGAQEALEQLSQQLQQQDQQGQQGQQGQQSQQGEQAQQTIERMADQMQQGQQQMAQQGQMPGEQDPQGQRRPGQSSQQGQPGSMGSENQTESQGGLTGESEGTANQLGEGNQPGAGEMTGFAEGEAPGGQGMGEQQGQQEGERGAGEGQAGFGESTGAGGTAEEEIGTDNEPGGRGERQYEAILDPSRIGGQGADEVDLPINPEDLEELPWQPGELAIPEEGESLVPYSEVFGDYANAVDEAMESGRIPLGLRGVIREYFSSLEP